MEASTQPSRPAPALQHQFSYMDGQEQIHGVPVETTSADHDAEYDPCQNAQKFSPFYTYNHESPRPSTDARPKQSIAMSVRDLELGEITPSVNQEKIHAQKNTKLSLADKMMFWKHRQPCLTKPKKQRWLQRLPKKQRIAVKAMIALIVVGAMVGIAVGIAAALHSTVTGTDHVVGKPT